MEESSLTIAVNSFSPSVNIGPKLVPIPDIFCAVNADDEDIRKNISSNISRDIPQVVPYETQWDKVVALVVGGPSLDSTLDVLKEKHAAGMPVVRVNGSYKYCMDRGIRPSAFIMLDSREFNNRFVDPPHKECKYFICSQCHPSVLDKLDGYETHLWHCAGQDQYQDILEDKYGEIHKDFFPVLGGSTVTLRAIHLMRMLGFPKFEIFGFDSCIMDKHHAYSQPENDGEKEIEVHVAGKQFLCTVAHYHQAKEFVQMVGATGDHYDMIIHGEGLISHIIQSPDALKEAA